MNYNKFEFQNPYQLRVADYLNDSVMKQLVQSLNPAFVDIRDQYLALQPDQDGSWSVGNTLSYLSLGTYKAGSTTSTATVLGEEELKSALGQLPPLQMSILLPLYEFINANKHFCLVLVSADAVDKTGQSTFSNLLSLSSYALHNSHRSGRAALYSCLSLLILQIMVEDPAVAKNMCSPDNAYNVRLCRQRLPLLPPSRGDRPHAATLLDITADGINHNLRRRLDIELYTLLLGLQLRLITYLGRTRSRLVYHWAELWRSLLSFVRFMNQYADALNTLPHIEQLAALLARVLALSVSSGERFLPDAKSYDDLFYKIFESGDALAKFRDHFHLMKGTSAASMSILINLSKHYTALLDDQKGKGNKNLSPRDVAKLIQQGYNSLSLEVTEELDHWNIYREADHRNMIKRVTRVVVKDAQDLLAQS